MIVIPAIDIRGGKVVRLTRGRPEDETVYADEPAEVGFRFAEAGAGWLHLVDLDAALGTGENGATVRQTITRAGIPVQLGGGLRAREAVDEAFEVGAARVVLGTEAIREPAFLTEIAGAFEDRVVVAVDTDGREVRVRGWTEDAGPIDHVLPVLEAAGGSRFLVTAVGRDGTLEGPDLPLYERIVALTDRPVLASGGVRSVDDIRSLADVGVEGVVVGKALYEGSLDLREALAEVR